MFCKIVINNLVVKIQKFKCGMHLYYLLAVFRDKFKTFVVDVKMFETTLHIGSKVLKHEN